MKKLLLLLTFLSFAYAASAQYATSSHVPYISVKGSRVFIEGEMLPKDQAAALFSDMNGVDRRGDYLKYRAGYKTGMGLSIGGASLVVTGSLIGVGAMFTAIIVGIPLAISGDQAYLNNAQIAMITAEVATITGLACVVAGIPTLCIYQRRIKDIAIEHAALTNSRQLSLTVGPTANGLGLALAF